MKFEVGNWYVWHQETGGALIADMVTVERLRKRGGALLSNGWAVDEDGFAEGTQRMPGGFVTECPPQASEAQAQ